MFAFHRAVSRSIADHRAALLRVLRARSAEPWGLRVNRTLATAVTALLVLGVARQLAGLTWTLIPGTPADAHPPAVLPLRSPSASADDAAPDIQAIIGAHLFGEFVEAPTEPVPVVEVPRTELSLQLKATVAEARRRRPGAAIIAGPGGDRTYTVGDEIEGADGTILYAIHPDRVILSREGELEALPLPKEELHGGTLAPAVPQSAWPAGLEGARTAAAVPALRTALSGGASRIAAILQVAAHIQQGQMIGFRLHPTDDETAFLALGLKPGDVVTEVNGTALRDPAQALLLFERLGESDTANLTLIRDGVPQVLFIDTSSLGAAATGR